MKPQTQMRLISRSLPIALVILTAEAALGQILLWDNDAGPAGTGSSHRSDPYRSLLEDFWFDEPVIMTDFSMLFIWNSGEVGRGERVDLILWSDEVGQPAEPFLLTTPLVYEEVFTGEIIFNRRLLDIRQQVVPFVIEPGTFWIEMHAVAEEVGAQLHTNLIGEEGWACYEDFPPCPRAGHELWRDKFGFLFKLFGFVPGESGDGFIRSIQPLLFSGDPQGGVEEIRQSDDEYYVLTASGVGLRISRVQTALVVFETTLPAFPLERLGLRAESTTDRPAVRQEIALFDFDADRWAVLDDRPLPNSGGDTVVTLENLPDPARFINDADGRTRMRLDAYAPGVSVIRHQFKVDELKLIVTYARP